MFLFAFSPPFFSFSDLFNFSNLHWSILKIVNYLLISLFIEDILKIISPKLNALLPPTLCKPLVFIKMLFCALPYHWLKSSHAFYPSPNGFFLALYGLRVYCTFLLLLLNPYQAFPFMSNIKGINIHPSRYGKTTDGRRVVRTHSVNQTESSQSTAFLAIKRIFVIN